MQSDATKTEAQEEEVLPSSIAALLNDGRFSEYHLEKAKLALASKDFKAARYQVAASLRHNPSDPKTAAEVRQAAKDLKAEIRRQAKAR